MSVAIVPELVRYFEAPKVQRCRGADGGRGELVHAKKMGFKCCLEVGRLLLRSRKALA